MACALVDSHGHAGVSDDRETLQQLLPLFFCCNHAALLHMTKPTNLLGQPRQFDRNRKARNVELSTETIDKGEILFNQSAFGAALFSVSKGIEAGSA